MLPPILMKGCSHSDPQCICRNLRSLDDYDDTPKPPPRRIKLVKRFPDEVFEDGSTTEDLPEVEVTVIEVTDIEDVSAQTADNEPVREATVNEEPMELRVDEIDGANTDTTTTNEGTMDSENIEDNSVESETYGSEQFNDGTGNGSVEAEVEVVYFEAPENQISEEEASKSAKSPPADLDHTFTEIEAQETDALEEIEEAPIESEIPEIEIVDNEEPGVVLIDNEVPSNETTEHDESEDTATETQDPASETTEYEEVEYGSIANETLEVMDEEREFKMCVEECSLHDQIRTYLPFQPSSPTTNVNPYLIS
jgi:hypothetical protein